jgi:multiple sugar transport system substrate-binding protein
VRPCAVPGTYLTNFPPANTGPLFGLNLQAGSHPYTIKSPTELTIAINDAAAKNVAGFWTPLIQDGSVSVDPDFTDSWFKGLASGKYATWLTAAWGPYFLTSSAATTAGKWGAAQLPQWTAGQNVSGYWGGSSLAVVKGSGSAAAAAGFVKFMTTDAATTRALSDKQHLYPTTTALLQDKTFLGTADPFYGGQKVNELLATISAGAAANYEWSPLEGYISSSITDTFGKAVTAKTDLGAGLDAWEQAVVAYGKDQGFTVNG